MRILSWLVVTTALTAGLLSAGCRKSGSTAGGGGGAGPGSVPVAADVPVIEATHTLTPDFVRKPTASASKVEIKRVSLSKDGSRVAAVAPDAVKAVQVWTVGGKPAKLVEWETRSDTAALSADGRRLAVTPNFQGAIIDIDGRAQACKVEAGSAALLQFCEPDLLLAVSNDFSKPGSTVVGLFGFDAASGEKRFSQVVSNTGQVTGPPVLFFDGGRQFVFLRDKSDTVEVWDSRDHKLTRQVPAKAPSGESSWSNSVVSPSGNLLATERKSTLLVWDLGSGEVIAQAGTSDVTSFRSAFLPGRDILVFAGIRKSDAGTFDIKAFDVQTRKIVAVFRGHPGGVQALDVSADGKWMASGDRDGTVRIWDLSNLE